jgi:hypothetical protein
VQLVPFGSDRAAISGSYRVIITSCWNAPGLNRKPPALSDLSEKAVCSRLMLAVMCLSRRHPHSHSNTAPIRESGILPHIEHVLLRMMPVSKDGRPFVLAVITGIMLGRALALVCYM